MTIHSYLALRAPPTRIEAAPWSSPRTIPARGYLRLFRLGLTCLCFPTNQGIPARVVSRGDFLQTRVVLHFAYFPANPQKRRADERTRTADLLITSVRSVVAGSCRSLQIPHK